MALSLAVWIWWTFLADHGFPEISVFLHKLILVWAHLNTCICIYFSSLLFFFPYSLRQGFNFSKSNFWSKQWIEPGDNGNDKGCQVVVKLEKSKFVSGLSKINESKLHLINHRQMIPAREHLLLPAFYKSNDWEPDMVWLSQSTQNTNHWD